MSQITYKPKKNIFKHLKVALFSFIILLMVTTPIALIPKEGLLNIYNWANYIPSQIILKFESETGIKVNYTTYDSNEALYAKLKTNPHHGYDVIVPSSYYVERMARQAMLQKLDLSKISNSQYLNPLLMNKSFDPHNQYSLPFAWGTTGIIVNDRYYDPKKIKRWIDLWDPKFKNQLLLSNDSREVFAMSLHTLGYSINDTNPQHIRAAYLKLRELIPNIKLFAAESVISIYTDEDAHIGMGFNGEAYTAHKENPHIHYIYPENQAGLWIDCFAIPKNATHLESAYRFINFI
ncbi:MAG TPA: spermidine/putrescine ABC transporter substrate-binding protein, partial [Coxiellaceae bacterium]|nr:spermidine/putrescine ABC transporter substrate-binding protein [Coxiellaceae bacterium]